ncbi:MAG: TIGR01777 family oxidoreductase [Porticoccaceae bacterium]|nr:TIGR01777 family oxidoreductase [Porticoccaceae bacterium]
MQGKSILLTGGSGFIGRHFCRSAVQSGAAVTVLTRDVRSAAKVVPESVTLCARLDQIDADKSFDTLVNLAGQPLAAGRWNVARKREFFISRVDFTARLVNFFDRRSQPPKQVISGSAVGYYGPGKAPVNELSAPADGFSHQLCDRWEAAARGFEGLGSRVCYLRTGIVLGELGALARMLPAFRLGLGGPIGDGQQQMSWIHRDDMISLIAHCIDHPTLSGPVNATAPKPVSNRQFSRALGRALGRPALLAMPGAIIRLLFGEMGDELLLRGQHALPEVLLTSGFKFKYPDLEVALEALLGKR